MPYLEAFYYNQITEIPDMWKDAYAHLRRLLEGKDYYIVSLTIDPYLSQMGFDMDRCVNPCGSVQRMQCRNGCTEELYIAKSIMQVFSEKLRQKMQDVSETELQESVLTDLVNDCREEIAKLICPCFYHAQLLIHRTLQPFHIHLPVSKISFFSVACCF